MGFARRAPARALSILARRFCLGLFLTVFFSFFSFSLLLTLCVRTPSFFAHPLFCCPHGGATALMMGFFFIYIFYTSELSRPVPDPPAPPPPAFIFPCPI